MFKLPELPYALDALAPYMSAETLEYHHGKHHKAYVDKLNELTASGSYQGLDLDQVIRKSAQDAAQKVLFNQAGQHWNHSFFWQSMKAKGGGSIPGALEKQLIADFGSLDAFTAQFKNACVSQFGSGWGWLVHDGEKLAITKTANADTPLVHGQTALLTCDVWEHAYYIDYRNMRPKYVEAFLTDLVDWEMVEQRYQVALSAQ
ncbi:MULTISPECIES: superoxide dismutase [unclassified Gluconobacter]|uniref:superoxide dismutase n=2 Tax=Gluconobacter TaxID=441 RepID=UPI0017767989|nr:MULTISPECIES: superoxide dismutase [unclassified Gluconobacter]GFE97080.1 superoxide dismutase [Gluconobacter sp. Gdi]